MVEIITSIGLVVIYCLHTETTYNMLKDRINSLEIENIKLNAELKELKENLYIGEVN